ncbi:MAG: flagellar basal body P-ring protein FlgI, partial [Aureliella sp.]
MLTFSRTRPHHLAIGLVFFCSLLSGCFSPWVSGDDPAARSAQIKDTLLSEKRPRIIGQLAFERMITLSRLENVALVTRLPGTGGIVKPSQPREKMLAIMRRYEVDQPNTFLDAPTSTMVVAHIDAPPAARRGDVMDAQIQLSAHSEATSLRQGWMMETSLVEMSRIGGQLREGFEMAAAHGPIVTAAEINGSDDPQDQTRGIIVGGATLHKNRDLGIGLEPEFADAVTMGYILPAINVRFTAFNGRKQAGIATPMEDSHIKLDVP